MSAQAAAATAEEEQDQEGEEARGMIDEGQARAQRSAGGVTEFFGDTHDGVGGWVERRRRRKNFPTLICALFVVPRRARTRVTTKFGVPNLARRAASRYAEASWLVRAHGPLARQPVAKGFAWAGAHGPRNTLVLNSHVWPCLAYFFPQQVPLGAERSNFGPKRLKG